MKKTSVCLLVLLVAAGTAGAQVTGPSTNTSPYVLPSIPGVTTTSIFTVGTGDTIGGYRMVGIPDGLGAFDNGDGSFTLTMNHELGNTAGIQRAHGQTGAFVSRWTIGSNLAVLSGRDLNTSAADAFEYTGAGVWSNAPSAAQAWNRYCSADMAGAGAYRYTDPLNGQVYGTEARIHLNGEESAGGRAYAHIVTGDQANQTWSLPSLGKAAWENQLASPFSQRQTIVMGDDDTSPAGEVYMYLGEKQSTGDVIHRAGLTGGNFYGVRVPGVATENRATGVSGRFEMYNHGDVTERSGASIQAEDDANGVTKFLRPEDGAWDPRPGHENTYYFVTTDRYDQPGQVGRSRLYKMSFDDITNPTAGGSITPLFSTEQGPQMMDNICVDQLGRIMILEDLGNNPALGKVWMFDTNTNGLIQIGVHDAARFLNPGPDFLTTDEETSGIIDAAGMLGQGWFLLDVQAHYGIPGELVEGGQLLALYVDPSIPAPGAVALLGLGGLVAVRRRRA
jgi:MYXO-CTERM domain-containing protein